MGSIIPLSHLLLVHCEQVKFRPKKNVYIKVSHSNVAVGTVVKGREREVMGGGGGAGRAKAVKHDMNLTQKL